MVAAYSESDDLALLRGVMAAHDVESTFWSPELRQIARSRFQQVRGSIPSLERVIEEVGAQRWEQLYPKIIEERKFKNALLGFRSPCHFCASEDDLVRWDFALMKVNESRVSLGATAASAAISAITFPLFGLGALSIPGRSHSGHALHLRIVTCKPCCKKHGNLLGLFMMNEERASKHPMWGLLHENGFTKFLTEEKIPSELRYSSDYVP